MLASNEQQLSLASVSLWCVGGTQTLVIGDQFSTGNGLKMIMIGAENLINVWA